MERPDEGPEWADDAHLDEVFSTWVPGPPESAPAAEREMAGENPPAEGTVSDEDLEAALAAALAEADGASTDDNGPAATPAPPQAARSEPRSPSWIDFPSAEDPPAPAPAPEPTVPAKPAMGPDPVAEPVNDFDSQPDDRSYDPAPPPPPEPAPEPPRPWTRSDDDILPGRRGKGRRR